MERPLADEFYKAMGKDSDYIMTDGFWSKDYPFPGSKELGERYYKKYNKDSVGVGMMYALCQILFQAIEKAGTLDGAKVRQAILDNEFNTTMGKVKYDEKAIALFPLPYFQWWRETRDRLSFRLDKVQGQTCTTMGQTLGEADSRIWVSCLVLKIR